MCSSGGLLTEYPSDEGPDAKHFPMRNRIIAGMCDALIVVETAAQGGSMITAHMGVGYGKDVFAVPGRAGDKMSQGCNNLLKHRKAHFIESAADIASIMRWDDNDKNAVIQSRLFVDMSENEQIIVDIMKQYEKGVLIDTLSFQSQINHSSMASLLLALEFKGLELQAEVALDAYKIALSAVEASRIESTRKLKSLVVIEPPSTPEKAEYPRRWYNLLTLLVGSLLLLAIVQLVLATIREHQD